MLDRAANVRSANHPMRVLLISTYELGHQPLAVASPATKLADAGHEARVVDVAIAPLDRELVTWAECVAISVPMHTAMRLAHEVVDHIRRLAPMTPIALYGLYAGMSDAGDAAFVGEYEQNLVEWVSDPRPTGVRTDLSVGAFSIPARGDLPPLEQYAHLSVGDRHVAVGYVEASHGCRHRCRHCPIPSVYDGAYRIVDGDTILGDIEQLVEMGAGHITFGDPDFLNGPAHSLRVLRRAHEEFPQLSFDVTIKVEHLIGHADRLTDLSGNGVLFITSAFETTHDASLALLDKGHTGSDLERCLDLTRAAGLDVRPSWMPFMPWTQPEHVLDIFEFIERFDLFDVTDPVQLSIRLLVPRGSLVCAVAGEYLDGYDENALSYRWSSVDPRSDALQARLAEIASRSADGAGERVQTIADMWSATLEACSRDVNRAQIPAGSVKGRPRMTEPWFC